MRILAIDPSICSLWVAILDNDGLIQAGTLKMKQTTTDRFLEIAIHIKKIILEYKPQALAIEAQYINGRFWWNAVLKTCEVKGVVRWVFMMLCPEGSIRDIAPSEAKKTMGVTGKRKEVKIAMVKVVMERFWLLAKVDDDACDAVAIWLCAYKKMTE